MTMKDDKFTIPIDLEALIMTLLQSRRANGYFYIDVVEIPPNIGMEYTFPVTPGYRAVPIEFACSPSEDDSVSMVVYTDGTLFVEIPGLSKEMSYPIKFLKDYYVFFWAINTINLIFYNKTNQTQKVYFRFILAEIQDKDYHKIVKRYMEVIQKWLLE